MWDPILDAELQGGELGETSLDNWHNLNKDELIVLYQYLLFLIIVL